MKIIISLFLFVGIAHSESPIIASYRNFVGGLNNNDASVSIAANESPDLMNVVIDEPIGALTQRNGYQSCGEIPSGNTATNLYEYSKNDGSRNLIVTDNVTIWQTPDCVQFSTIATGLSSLDLPRFATILDKLWIVNGSTWPITWDGATATYLDGSGTLPAGPKGKYISYWKSRVWIANTPTAPSSVYFTSLTDSIGNIVDPSLSTAAWSSLNQIYINRDDGSPLYGIKPYRDNLYAFKDTGISRIVFESEYDLSVAKNVSAIGSKFQESIVEMDDGLLRFVGRDGVYAFDGSSVKRLSTKWTPTFYTIKQPSRGEQYKLWDTPSDWLAGTVDSNISTSVVAGSLGLMYEDFSDLNYTANPIWTPTFGTFTSTNSVLESIAGNGVAFTSSSFVEGTLTLKFYGRGSDTATMIFITTTTPETTTANIYGYGVRLTQAGPDFWCIEKIKGTASSNVCCGSGFTDPQNVAWDISVSRSGAGDFTMSVSSSTDKVYSCSGTDTEYSATTRFVYQGRGWIDDISIIKKSTGVFTSQISTATGLTIWNTFGVDETKNGQTIAYQIRTATSVYNIGLESYRDITPGALVSSGTEVYAQWKANFSTTDNGITPLLNSASIGWITGDSSKSVLYGLNYKSRYWLSAATSTANNYNDFVMVESRSPLGTYTRHNLPISAMTLWNGNLYGAVSNSPNIARFDYGSTDDGGVINSYWQSRDEVYDNPIFYKSVNIGVLDYSNTPANTGLTMSLSNDLGTTWEDRTINLSASTLSRNTEKINYTPETALGFRTKISNSVLGIGFKVYGAHTFGTMSDYYGN